MKTNEERVKSILAKAEILKNEQARQQTDTIYSVKFSDNSDTAEKRRTHKKAWYVPVAATLCIIVVATILGVGFGTVIWGGNGNRTPETPTTVGLDGKYIGLNLDTDIAIEARGNTSNKTGVTATSATLSSNVAYAQENSDVTISNCVLWKTNSYGVNETIKFYNDAALTQIVNTEDWFVTGLSVTNKFVFVSFGKSTESTFSGVSGIGATGIPFVTFNISQNANNVDMYAVDRATNKVYSIKNYLNNIGSFNKNGYLNVCVPQCENSDFAYVSNMTEGVLKLTVENGGLNVSVFKSKSELLELYASDEKAYETAIRTAYSDRNGILTLPNSDNNSRFYYELSHFFYPDGTSADAVYRNANTQNVLGYLTTDTVTVNVSDKDMFDYGWVSSEFQKTDSAYPNSEALRAIAANSTFALPDGSFKPTFVFQGENLVLRSETTKTYLCYTSGRFDYIYKNAVVPDTDSATNMHIDGIYMVQVKLINGIYAVSKTSVIESAMISGFWSETSGNTVYFGYNDGIQDLEFSFTEESTSFTISSHDRLLTSVAARFLLI